MNPLSYVYFPPRKTQELVGPPAPEPELPPLTLKEGCAVIGVLFLCFFLLLSITARSRSIETDLNFQKDKEDWDQ